MQKVLVATTNQGKLREIKEYLSHLPIEFVSLKDVGITQDVEENGKTYEENSQKKALVYSQLSGLPSISDDGGLEIAALGGAPGVDTKYFGNAEGSEEAIIEKMKQVIQEVPDNNRAAQFVAVLSLALPTGEVWSERSAVDLVLAKKPNIKYLKGFPYRSFLLIPGLNKYYHESELSEKESKEYNHRYKALMKLEKIIKRELAL